VERSLERLGLDHVDLYIIHWPKGGPTWAWPGMERARELGYARSIGVSNFDVAELDQLRATASVAPVVNQVQFSPYEYRRGLLDACREEGIALEAYSPLGTGRHLSSETVRRIAQRLGRTAAQVLLRWCVQRDVPLIPKSTHRDRIAENAQILDFSFSQETMAELHALERGGGGGRGVARVCGAAPYLRSDQIEARQRVGDLLHLAAGRQVAEVDRGEPRVLEESDHLLLCVRVVAGEED